MRKMTKSDLEKKVEGQKALIEQQRETIRELTEKTNDLEPIDVIIKVIDLDEESDKEAFYIEESFLPRDIELLEKVFRTIEYKAAFPIQIFREVKED